MIKHVSLAVLSFVIALPGCKPSVERYSGELSKPAQARIDLKDTTLAKFDERAAKALLRYLAGNERWEVREEQGLRFAIRKELVGGRYQTSLNGFYSGPAESFRATRVLIAFGRPSGLGRDRRNVTRARVGDTDVPVILEAAHGGAPGNTSYLVIAGDRLYLELYEQASETERVFTKAAFAEVSAELADVLTHLDEVERTGILPVAARYPATTQPAGGFEVADGMQPGIYLLRALVNPRTPGRVHARVFETATGKRLSAARIQKSSTRTVGWTEDSSRGFPYSAEVTVYEGDWSTQYEARFELWHVDEQGHELKLAEATRKINGWER